ncbi:MAG TPA: SCO family protein [Brumimicrobium sp.]|nr:SCO family protein [Brumimicrobium sp.]
MRVLLTAIILIAGIFTAYYMTKASQERKSLPVIQPRDVNAEMLNPELAHIGIGHRIGEFKLRNQNGEEITLKDVRNKIFVAEYFFTTCPTICPIMTEEMKRVQQRFKGNNEVKILSFTVNPEHDSVEVMKAYAEEHGAVDGQWHFLTGTKEDLYHLARNSFFVLKPAEAKNLGDAGSDFIHTNNFVLVDTELRIRGYYDGTSKEEVDILMDDIELLLNEK